MIYIIGENLFQAYYNYAETLEHSFIQVKTVREGCYKEYECI